MPASYAGSGTAHRWGGRAAAGILPAMGLKHARVAALALVAAVAAPGCGKSPDPVAKRVAAAVRHDRYLPTGLIDTVKCTRAQDVYACSVGFRDGRTARCTVATYNGAVEGLSCTRPRHASTGATR